MNIIAEQPFIASNLACFLLAGEARGFTVFLMGWILFFDGDCAFCSKSVRMIVRLDHRGVVSFAPLQGELGKEMGFSHHAAGNGGTMVLVREADGSVFTESEGLIELASALGGWWRIFTVARLIPKPWRDFGYRLIARNRYRFMGKAEACAMPDPELLKRLRN